MGRKKMGAMFRNPPLRSHSPGPPRVAAPLDPPPKLDIQRTSSRSERGVPVSAAKDEVVHSTSQSRIARVASARTRAQKPKTPPDAFDQTRYDDANWDYLIKPGEFFRDRYLLEKIIGRGSFGQVIRAYDTITRDRVAIKIIKSDKPYFQQALQEVRMTAMLQRLDPDDSHCIIRLHDKFIYRGHQCLVFELLSHSLYDLLSSNAFLGVSMKLVRKFAWQILTCLEFLARPSINIIHSDLKPENVLLRHDQRSQIRVVDFGSSCVASGDPSRLLTYVQSRFYRAPEVILGIHYGVQIDVWSLGCMLVELLTGIPLFAGHDEGDQIALICEGVGLPPTDMLKIAPKRQNFFAAPATPDAEYTILDHVPRRPVVPLGRPIYGYVRELVRANAERTDAPATSEADLESFLDLVQRLLVLDPLQRMTAADAMKHHFFSGSIGAVGEHEGGELESMSASIADERKNPGDAEEPTGVVRQSGRNAPVPAVPIDDGGPPSGSLAAISIGNGPQQNDELPNGTGQNVKLQHPPVAPHIHISLDLPQVPVDDLERQMQIASSIRDWTAEFGIEPPLWRDTLGQHVDLPERPPSIATGTSELKHLKCFVEPHYRFGSKRAPRRSLRAANSSDCVERGRPLPTLPARPVATSGRRRGSLAPAESHADSFLGVDLVSNVRAVGRGHGVLSR